MRSNSDAESSTGRRQTPGAQYTTSIDADRAVFTDRDGRELSLLRVSDGAELPVLGHTERAIAWGTSPTRTDTHAGHVSIDVGAGVPDARYYPQKAAEDAPHSVSLSARVLNPVEAGYGDVPFVVRLLADEFVTARHGGLLPPAYDLVYHSLADHRSADESTEGVCTDGGAVVGANLAQAVDYDALDPDDDLEYLVTLAYEATEDRAFVDATRAATWVIIQWLQDSQSLLDGRRAECDGENERIPDGGYIGTTDEAVRAAVEAAEAAEADDEWNPEPVSLREGESRDDMGHATRNLEMLEQGLDDGVIALEDLSEDQRNQLDVDEDEIEPPLVTDGGRDELSAALHEVDQSGLDMDNDLEYLVGLACEAAEADEFEDDFEAAQWVVAHWMQELRVVPDLSGYTAGQTVPKTAALTSRTGAFERAVSDEVVAVCALDTTDPDVDVEDDQVVAHGMDQECVREWGLEGFVIDRGSPFWHEGLDGISPGETVSLEADSYDDVAPRHPDREIATDGGRDGEPTRVETDGRQVRARLSDLSNRLLGDRAPQARAYRPSTSPRTVSDGGATVDPAGAEDPLGEPEPLSFGDEVYDHDRGLYGEVRQVVEDAQVGGGRTVDRLRIRWGSGDDEWFHRTWLNDGSGRRIVPVAPGAVTEDDRGEE